MKVVLDSNVLVAAFATRGLCTSVFELCIDRCDIVASEFILGEVYKTMNVKFAVPPEKLDGIIDYLRENCEIASYPKPERTKCRDQHDDDILALAAATGADFLITGDKDLLIMQTYKNSRIVDPREFWNTMKNV